MLARPESPGEIEALAIVALKDRPSGRPRRGEAKGLVFDCVERQSRLRIQDLRGIAGEMALAARHHRIRSGVGAPKARILAFDSTPAGLVTAPLRTEFKYLWKRLRDVRFASGDFHCEICSGVEAEARLIHAHEVYPFPDPTTVHLDRVIFVCYRCHDAIHLDRLRSKAKPPYLQEIRSHYCHVNGGISEKDLEADYRAAIQRSQDIRTFYGGAEAKPRLDYGPFQDRAEDIQGERIWRKLGLRLPPTAP